MNRWYILQSKEKFTEEDKTKYRYTWKNLDNDNNTRIIEKSYIPKQRRPGRPRQSDEIKEMKRIIRKDIKLLNEDDIRELYELLQIKLRQKIAR